MFFSLTVSPVPRTITSYSSSIFSKSLCSSAPEYEERRKWRSAGLQVRRGCGSVSGAFGAGLLSLSVTAGRGVKKRRTGYLCGPMVWTRCFTKHSVAPVRYSRQGSGRVTRTRQSRYGPNTVLMWETLPVPEGSVTYPQLNNNLINCFNAIRPNIFKCDSLMCFTEAKT